MAEFALETSVAVEAIRSLIADMNIFDGNEPLSEHKAGRLGAPDESIGIVRLAGNTVAGYAQAAWHRGPSKGMEGHWAVEVVLDPRDRGPESVGETLRELLGRLPPGERVAVWSSLAYVTEGLHSAGYREVRRLLRLGRPLPDGARISMPYGTRLRPFAAGEDDRAWLDLNNAAFAGHPENGTLGRADLDERLGLAWYDPAGFLVAEREGRLVGFCWTKVHEDTIGEIYIIAVSPDDAGHGLGRALLAAGTDYLHRQRGAGHVFLYAESDNAPALRLYEAAGFEIEAVSRQFER